MNIFNKCFVLLQLLVQILSAVSYTVVLKQVKPLYPSVKVYRYELRHPKILQESNAQYVYHKPLLGQRIYPVLVKPGKEGNYKARVPLKKEKGKFYKFGSSTDKPILRDPRLLGLSQHLVPPVSNKIEDHSEAKEEEIREEENDIRPLLASSHAGKSFSSFGQEKGRIYNNPGEWATPVPKANSENTTKAEFTPSQLYLQIRHKNTVIHVPQSEALKDAETLEELINAPRLKQLSRTTHVQETYSEEGYEDAGYDHAGHIRQAQHGEVYDAKDEGKFKIKEAPIVLDYDSDLEESKKVPLKSANEKQPTDSTEESLSNKLEPRITRSRSEISKTSVEYMKIPTFYKGEHKYSSRVKIPVKITQTNESGFNLTNATQHPSVPPTFPSYFGELPPTPEIVPEIVPVNDSVPSYIPPGKISSKYRKGPLNSTKIYAVSESPEMSEYTDFKPYISVIDSQASPSAKNLKYSRIYSKKTKHLRLQPYKNDNIYSPPRPPPPPPPPPPNPESPPHSDLQPPRKPDKAEEEEDEEEEKINQRIVLPTIGYINSLTTAHFGKENAKDYKEGQNDYKTQLTDALNLTQALDYLRLNKNQKSLEPVKTTTEIDIRTFEPMKLKKQHSNSHNFVNKTKRDVYLIGERNRRFDKISEQYEGNNESDLPHVEKSEEIAEDEKKRIEEENREKEKFESDLRQEIVQKEKEIIKETFKNIGVEDDVSEVFPEIPSSDSETEISEEISVETTPSPVDIKKYPFYKSKKLPENSPLRYATDPKQFPKKSGYKMEFYDSREQVIQCPDIHPDLGDLPDSNSTEYSDDQPGENKRITGVGDKIACLRMKYFDPEPFDNPIFKEKEIDYVGKPLKHMKTQPKRQWLNKDQNFQQTNRQKSFVAKPKNQKGKNGSDARQPLKPHSDGEAIENQTALPNSNESVKLRIIPVTEIVDELPATAATTFQNKPNPRPMIGWKTTYHSTNQPRGRPQASGNKKEIFKPHNCLPNISKLAALDGTKNVTINCNDVTLVQEIIKNVARLRIIPRETNKEEKSIKRKWNEKPSLQRSSDQTDWVPIVGYFLPKHISLNPFGRRTDEVTGLKNETTNNSSHVYVIDELKEDENVRKGEVVEDMDHYMKMMEGLKDDTTEVTTLKTESKTENSTRRRREVQTDPGKLQNQKGFDKKAEAGQNKTTEASGKREVEKPIQGSKRFELKRPLTRLSGLDFLTRYHKNKGKSTAQKTEDFWKIETTGSNTAKSNQKPLKNNVETEKLVRPFAKIKEKFEKATTTSQPTTEASTIKSEITEISDIIKPQASTEKPKIPKIRTNEPRKISPSNLIPEKITKRPEVKTSEFWKTFNQTPVAETTTLKPPNFIKVVTKISKETSESSEKPRTAYKKPSRSSSTESPTVETSSARREVPQYKTINRSSTPESNDSEYLTRPTEKPPGPILYYVVNVKTGKGKWITNYEEETSEDSRKHRKSQKAKEGSGTKRDKRRKKPRY